MQCDFIKYDLDLNFLVLKCAISFPTQGCHHSSNTPRIGKLLESSSNPPRIQTASSRMCQTPRILLESSSNPPRMNIPPRIKFDFEIRN